MGASMEVMKEATMKIAGSFHWSSSTEMTAACQYSRMSLQAFTAYVAAYMEVAFKG